MSAEDSVSPEQFGFMRSSTEDTFGRPEMKSKLFDVSTNLHSRQAEMKPSVVEGYKSPSWARKNGSKAPPEIVKHGGEHIIMNGHHRIAAARAQGKKRIKVLYGETGGEVITQHGS